MNPHPINEHQWKLREEPELRGWNSKTFRHPYDKHHGAPMFVSGFHVKPIHYVGLDGRWHDLKEVASYFGNKRGMVLRYGWESKIHMDYLVWYYKRLQLLKSTYGIAVGNIYEGIPIRPLLLNTTTTARPDPNPESATFDGGAVREPVAEDWASIQGGAGTGSNDSNDRDAFLNTGAGVVLNLWISIRRLFFLFDVTAIPDTDVISAVTFSAFNWSLFSGTDSFTDNIFITSSTPASSTAVANTDYSQTGTTKFSDTFAMSSWYGADGQQNNFTFNAAGIAGTSKTAITKLAMRGGYDIENSSPTWGSGGESKTTGHFADYADTSRDPLLTVTHAAVTFKPIVMIM